MAVAARGGPDQITGVVFHTDRGATYTANTFTALCRRLHIRQSMGRVGSCFDNAAAEAFFSGLEWEVLSRHHFNNTAARAVVLDWCYGFYNHTRRHRAANEVTDRLRERRGPQPDSRVRNPPRFRGNHTAPGALASARETPLRDRDRLRSRRRVGGRPGSDLAELNRVSDRAVPGRPGTSRSSTRCRRPRRSRWAPGSAPVQRVPPAPLTSTFSVIGNVTPKSPSRSLRSPRPCPAPARRTGCTGRRDGEAAFAVLLVQLLQGAYCGVRPHCGHVDQQGGTPPRISPRVAGVPSRRAIGVSRMVTVRIRRQTNGESAPPATFGTVTFVPVTGTATFRAAVDLVPLFAVHVDLLGHREGGRRRSPSRTPRSPRPRPGSCP